MKRLRNPDRYPQVPWMDREENLVWHEGQETQIEEPSFEDFTRSLPSQAASGTLTQSEKRV